MRSVQPQVFLVARPSIDYGELAAYLREVGGESWLERLDRGDLANDAQNLAEFAGRLCYRSWEPGLNPNVSRIRADQDGYLRNILGQLHGSVLEHASFSFVLHNVSRVLCYDSETEVLTADGWVRWPDVCGDELFAQVDERTHELSYARASQRFRRQYDGPMYRLKSEQVDLLVTPHHSLFVRKHDTQAARRGEQPWEKVPAQEVAGKRVHHLKTVLWRGAEPQKVTIPGTERSWVRRDTGTRTVRSYEGWSVDASVWAEWLGWYLAEGNLADGHRICITQNDGPQLRRIEELSRQLGRPVPGVVKSATPPEGRQLRLSDACLHDWLLATTGGRAPNKRLPGYVRSWSPRLIRILLVAMVEGDGSTRKTGNHRVIYTSSRQLADDLQELAIKAGWSANVRHDDRRGRPGGRPGIVNRHISYVVSLVETRIQPVVNRKRGKNDGLIHYSGEVHCVAVPSGLLVVRRNGKPVVCGNTHELARHRPGTAISQESLRYVRLADIPFWFPEWARQDAELMKRATAVVEQLEEFQRWLADHFGLDEDGTPFHEKKHKTSFMRRFAPDGVATGLIWTANIRALRHTIEARTDPGAEEEIRLVFGKIGDLMRAEAPALFGDYEITDGAWVPRWRKV
jgi:thymidylate synthase ThyX